MNEEDRKVDEQRLGEGEGEGEVDQDAGQLEWTDTLAEEPGSRLERLASWYGSVRFGVSSRR